jgi:hypothetical protein
MPFHPVTLAEEGRMSEALIIIAGMFIAFGIGLGVGFSLWRLK